MDELRELCQSLGIEGAEALAFCRDERAKEREERKEREEKEREERKEEKEREERKEREKEERKRVERKEREEREREERKEEKDREEREREREERVLQIRLEAEEKERESEERFMQLTLQADDRQRDHDARMVVTSSNSQIYQIASRTPKLRLAPFDERVNTIEEYLALFERQATLNEVPESKQSHVLGSLLTGKAVSVYSELTIEELTDFEDLKRALLVRYGLTENGYRAKFKGITPRPDDDPTSYMRRIKDSLEEWIAAAKVEKRAEDILKFLPLTNNCQRFLRTLHHSSEKGITRK